MFVAYFIASTNTDLRRVCPEMPHDARRLHTYYLKTTTSLCYVSHESKITRIACAN